MNKCKLCNQVSELQQSHIIPRFVYKYMLITTGNDITQYDGNLNLWQKTSRQFKECLFCTHCEQLLGMNENQFSKIFKEINASTDKTIFVYTQMNDEILKTFESTNFTETDIKEFLISNPLHGKMPIFEYFAISYIYRELVRKEYNIDKNIIDKFRNYLLNKNECQFMLTVRVHNREGDFDMCSTVIVMDDLPDFKHFVFYLPNLQFHFAIHVHNTPSDLVKTVIIPSDFFNDEIETLQLIKEFQKGSKKARNLAD
ncbi:hypothetical protein H5087_09085 [Pseudoalteromonas sp. SR43-7]|uniref:hypothetical protein n=1 Tax=Pseudoalteromonas sp. SR43-7 TaxID=2760939 RepID=UPI0015F9CA8D|nr:hypothetical protein [Pseudoalteromonas sp. SR43-7]MBB1329500.1 hypothetical protein [Pseudoalteromonas sp. SR43-7]